MKISNIINKFTNIINNLHQQSLIYNSSLRQRDITTNMAINYCFHTSKYNCSKSETVDFLNTFNNNSFTSSGYYKKEYNIPIETYKYINNELINIHDEIINTHHILKHKYLFNLIHSEDDIINMQTMNDYVMLAADASKSTMYGNEHNTITLNPIYVYDITHGKVIYTSEYSNDLFINNAKNLSDKNHESLKFIEYIKLNHLNLKKMYPNKKIIFLLDRAYYSSKLVDLLDKYNFGYVMRLKNNSKKITSNESRIVTHIHSTYSSFIRKDKHNDYIDKTIKKSELKNRKYTYEYTDPINLLTSIPQSVANDKTIDFLYSLRWNIELYFKKIKASTNLDFINTSIFSQVEKLKYVSSSIDILSKILVAMYYINNNFKCKSLTPNLKIYYKPNYAKLINNMYLSFFNKLFNNTLSSDFILSFLKRSIVIKKYDKNRKFSRVAIQCTAKWYSKGYSNNANYKKLVVALYTNNLTELNKNDLVKINNIKNLKVTEVDQLTVN